MAYKEVAQEEDGKGKGKKEAARYSDHTKTTVKQKAANFGRFIFDPRKKTVLDRNCASWAKIGAFYLVFYLALAGVWTGFLFAFFSTIEDTQPRLQNWDSLIKYNPGMGFRPQPDVEKTVIRFEQGVETTYSEYTENLDLYLEPYAEAAQIESGLVDCADDDVNRDPSLPCKYPMYPMLGEKCTSALDYGFDEGRPCVLLKMNKLFNWTPDPFDNGTAPIEGVRDGFIKVTCEGTEDADKDNIGKMEFWPSAGFDASYFPYKNQKGYLQPLVMVQFQEPRPGTLIQVICKVWAKNIYHDKNDRAGSVRFEILVD